MALLFYDGFDHLATTDLVEKGWLYSGATVSTSYKRLLGNGVRLSNQTHYLQRAFTGADTIILGFGWYAELGASISYNGVVQFRNGSDVHINVTYDHTLKRFDIRNNAGTILGSTAINSVLLTTWYYVEIKVYVHDSAGTVEVYLSETSALTSAITGADTRNGSSTTIDNILFGSTTSNTLNWAYIDDVYIANTSGGAPTNTFLGDVVVQTLTPTSDSSVAWTKSTGATNYGLVDDATPNSDTDYVYSSTGGQQDIYGFSNLASNTSTVYAVKPIASARKDDAGTRSIKVLTKSTGTYASSATALTTSYLFYDEIREVDPNTSAAWTVANVNAAEFGVEVV